jgi:tetratricopeptide (TPR) repeat protein
MSHWHPFPHDNAAFRYPGTKLATAWPTLHVGDRVPWPDESWVTATLEANPSAAPSGFQGDIRALANDLQEAWRAFHHGEFGIAIDMADRYGPLAYAAANKAAGVYGSYLEDNEKRQQACFMDAAGRAERATQLLPEDPNSHYFHAFNLGRYSQSVSVVEALRKGIGGKIEASLNRALELAPDHAEAHTALGLYHAEIIDKIGRMIGAMTYGANADKAEAHFQRALELAPESPIAHIEYGNGLYLMHGEKRLDEVTDLYVKASEMTPRDAMEFLDIEAARAELE